MGAERHPPMASKPPVANHRQIRGPREFPDLERHAVRALLTELPTPLPIVASQHPLTIYSPRTFPAAQQNTHATENRSAGKPVFSHGHLQEDGHSAIRRRSFCMFAGGIVTDSSSVSTIQPNTSNRESQLVIFVRIATPNRRGPVRPTIGSGRTRGTVTRGYTSDHLETIGPLRGCHRPRSTARKIHCRFRRPNLEYAHNHEAEQQPCPPAVA